MKKLVELKEHIKKLTFQCSSSVFKPLSINIFSDANQIVFIEEIPYGGLIRYTKFRTMLKLEIKISGYYGDFFLYRQAGINQKYILRRGFGENLFFFQPKGFLSRRWEVKDNVDIVIANFKHKNPFIIGSDDVNIYLNDDTLYAKISLKFKFSFFNSYKDGEIIFFEERQLYEPIAIAICIISIIDKQQR